MKKNNLILIGFRGAGKTFFGRRIAQKLNLPFADLDQEIEFSTGYSIPEYIDKFTWQAFREVEQKVTHDFCRNFSGVVATGGGTIENSKNLQTLTKNGELIFLNPDFFQVRKFLMKDKTRPRLNPDISISQEIDQMWQQRKPMYQACANYEVQPDYQNNAEEEVEKIIAALPKKIIPDAAPTKKVIVMASGNGTTFRGVLEAQEKGRIPNVSIEALITNKKDAKAIEVAKKADIPVEILEAGKGIDEEDYDREIINIFREYKPDYILLMGWMKIFSPLYCQQLGEKTINVHPSLLPAYTGMKDLEIHEKVLENQDRYTGCSLHRITTQVDGGEVILQRKVLIEPHDTPKTLKDRVQRQEVLGFCEFLERKK